MISTVTLSNGQSIWMNIATGEVIESSQSRVTSVEQSAPTVVSDGKMTTVIPGQVSSRTDVASELWLRMPDGRERSFNFQNIQVPVRVGHRVSVLWGAPTGHENGWYFGTRNHTTGTSNVDLLGALDAGLKQWGLKPRGNLAALGVMVACMAIGALITLIKSSGADQIGDIILGALFGFGAFILMSPLLQRLLVVPRVMCLVKEIEQFARERLAERDAPDFVPTDTRVDNRSPAAASSGTATLKWGFLTAVAAVLGLIGWFAFRTPSPELAGWGQGRPPAYSSGTQGPNHSQQSPRPVPSSTDWSAFNTRQLQRHEELLARAPSTAEMESLPEALRPAATSLAALYTLFPKGHEKPFPAVVEMLSVKGAFQAGSPLTVGQLSNILRGLNVTSSHRNPGTPGEVAQALESGKSVFVPDGADLLRLTAVQRDASGQLTGFMVYDPAGRIQSPASLSILAPLWSGNGVVVSAAKAAF